MTNKKKWGVNIQINLTNKWVYALMTVGFAILLGFGVYAVDTSQPWHSVAQMDFSGGISGDVVFNNNVDILGTLDVGGNVKISDSGSACVAANAGEIRFSVNKFYGCDGSGWIELGGSATVPNPTINTFSVNDPEIPTGSSATLTWDSSGAISCVASGGWSGAKSLSGSKSVSPGSSTTYTLTCTNSAGSVSSSVRVNVKQWADTSGEGNWGESCDDWLARTSQSGIDGSIPRARVGSTNYEGQCMYERPYDSSSNTWCGTRTGATQISPSSPAPTCGCYVNGNRVNRCDLKPIGTASNDYYRTQTRR